jgi:copper transport protein
VRRRGLLVALVAAAALALPAAAWAHAALLKTYPVASQELTTPPKEVRLVFDEVIEPRFAVISVTDAGGHQQTSGPPVRSATNPYELDVPLKRVREGWYLVFWRVISADGHPVRGVFTFSLGPNAGPIPQFVIPSLSETAATPGLVTARWLTFLSVMIAIGLFTLRAVIARPLATGLRGVTVAFGVALAVALVATPVYVLAATSQFALRSFWDVGALVPLMHASPFGRAFLDLELVLVLFGLAGFAAIWLDRPDRPKRSLAALLALVGALLAAGAALFVPGAAGHAAQTSPRALSIALDWLHLTAGSVWLGGLVGLLVLWWSTARERRAAALAVVVPRFSNVAFVSVMALIGTGTGASLLHLPTLASLWTTSYGKTILVKIALLATAMLVASVNLLKTKPALESPEPPARAGAQLRSLVGIEAVLVTGAVLAAAVLSSLPPPSSALASLGSVAAHTGPGPVVSAVQANGYRLVLRVDPNRAAVSNTFSVEISRNGKPTTGATVIGTFNMLDMQMPAQSYRFAEKPPGTYSHVGPTLVMVGHWGISLDVEPKGGQPFTVVFVDRANG